jgi:hypothetical protein
VKNACRWYDREHWAYKADRDKVAQYADWLKQVNWRLFCTFTFAWSVSDPQADRTFREFINRLEKYLRGCPARS